MNPVLRAPERISPTQLSIGRACPLRLVLDGSTRPEDRSLPSQSPVAYLGRVFHGLVEDARRGRAGDPPERSRLEELWRSRIRAAEASAREQGDEAWLPFEESYHRLERLRLRAMGLAELQSVRKGQGDGIPSTEAWLESTDGLVVGKVDAIDREGDSVVLRDLKSGVVADEDGSPLEDHRLQMTVYAGLFHEATGRWPDRLELVGGRGDRVEVPFDPSGAVAVLEECKAILRTLHVTVGGGAGIEDPEVASLARTEGGACRSCQHRPCCPSHLRRMQEEGVVRLDDGSFPVVDLLGTVVEVGAGRDDDLHLVVRHGAVLRRIRRVAVRSTREPVPATVVGGESVAIFGVVPNRPLEVDPAHEQLLPMRSTRAFLIDRQAERRGVGSQG